jgi:hypothetical protein
MARLRENRNRVSNAYVHHTDDEWCCVPCMSTHLHVCWAGSIENPFILLKLECRSGRLNALLLAFANLFNAFLLRDSLFGIDVQALLQCLVTPRRSLAAAACCVYTFVRKESAPTDGKVSSCLAALAVLQIRAVSLIAVKKCFAHPSCA